MKRIVYLIAVHDPLDLKKVAAHAAKLAAALKKHRVFGVEYAALFLVDRADDPCQIIQVGNNKQSCLEFYSRSDKFISRLKGFSSIPINGPSNASLYETYRAFSEHETKADNKETRYQIIMLDYRQNMGAFLGAEADLLVRDLSSEFRDRASMSIFIRSDNKQAYSDFVVRNETYCALMGTGSKFGVRIVSDNIENLNRSDEKAMLDSLITDITN